MHDGGDKDKGSGSGHRMCSRAGLGVAGRMGPDGRDVIGLDGHVGEGGYMGCTALAGRMVP